MDNSIRYGFSWTRGSDGGKAMPTIEEFTVATSQSFDVNGGAANVKLGKGDPVRITTTGTATLCDGVEGAGGVLPIYGVCAGIKQYYDGTKLVVSPEFLPSDIAWGTNRERASKIYVIPISNSVWELDCNTAAAGFDTEIEYEDMIGENVNFILTGASGELRANPRLDITNQATTATFILRIVNISKTVANKDVTGNNWKMQVIANVAQRPWSAALGT